MTIVNLDHGIHGEIVQAMLETHYDSEIIEVDFGTNSPSFGDVAEIAARAIKHDPVAVNLSYGSANTERPETMLGRDYTQTLRELFAGDVVVTVAAGNRKEDYGDKLGVSWLAASPWCLSVSALDDGSPADYSQWSPLMTTVWADGYSSEDDVQGTSICAPLACGLFGQIKESADLTNAEAFTLYERTATPFVARGYHTWKLDGVHAYHQWALNEDDMLAAEAPVEIDSFAVVDGAYEVFLGRQPDPEGLRYWSEQENLEDAVSEMIAVAYECSDSNHQAVPVFERVQGMYHSLLHREADMDGMVYWIDRVLEYYDEVYYLSMGVALWGHVTQEFSRAAIDNEEHVFCLEEVELLAHETRADEIGFNF